MLPYRFPRNCLRLALLTGGRIAVIIAVVVVVGFFRAILVYPQLLGEGHWERLAGTATGTAEIAAAGAAMIWAGRQLRFFDFPKANPKTAATAEYVVYRSGAPGWVDVLAVVFVSLGFFGLLYVTSGYNPSAFIPRLIAGFGAVYLFPRVWLTMNNEASRDLRWKLRRFFPDKPLIWDTGPCLCVDGQQIPWLSIDTIGDRTARFKHFITIKTKNPSARIEVNVSLALQNPDAIKNDLWMRRFKKIADSKRSPQAPAEGRARAESLAA